MAKKTELIPLILPKKGEQPTKLQKDFNQQIKLIQQLKEELESIKNRIKEVQIRYNKEIVPIEDEFYKLRIMFIKQMDKLYDSGWFKKRGKKKIEDIILTEIEDIIIKYPDELTEVFDKYSDYTYKEMQEDMLEQQKEMSTSFFKNIFGVEIDMDDIGDLNNPENFFRLADEVKNKIGSAEEFKNATKRKNKKLTPAQEAKELKAKEELQNLNKAARNIYTNLIKELHPDLEKDEQQRIIKTEQVKQVTEAYEKNDLYRLFQLQIELNQQNRDEIADMPEEQLKFYIKILKEQVKEMKGMIESISFAPPPIDEFIERFNVLGTPRQVTYKFNQEKKKFQTYIGQLNYTLSTLDNKAEAIEYVNQYRIPTQETEIDLNELLSMMEGFEQFIDIGQKKKKKK